MRIFTDASFNDKHKVAGWGIVIKDGTKERTYSNWLPVNNINLAEIFAIHTACVLSGGKNCTIYTDSQTALAYINGNVRDDKPRTREQWLNHKKMMFWAYKIRKFNANVQWTKGHKRTFQMDAIDNNMADLKAKSGLSKYLLTIKKERVR